MSKPLLGWLIFCLLIANVMLFVWPRKTVEPALDRPGFGAERLVLLDEVAERALEIARAEELAESPTELPTESPTELPAEQPTELPAEQLAEQPAEPETAETESTVLDKSVESSVVEIEPEPEPEPPRCWLAGPVENASLREHLETEFNSQGLVMDRVLRRVAAAPEYRVYLPVAGGEVEQLRLTGELRARGIDYYVIKEGVLAGNISLGLFRSEDSARTVAAQVREAGYRVETLLRPREREEPWIALDDIARLLLGWTDEPGVLPQYLEMRIEEQDCPAPRM